jgi:hypothetical protein
MSAFDVKDRLGIDGTEAWVVAANNFDDLLDLVYMNHRGEIWLFNNDLTVFKDHDLFLQIYVETIVKKLGPNISSIKILVCNKPEIESLVFPKPSGVVAKELCYLFNYAQKNKYPVPPILFGKYQEALAYPGIADMFGVDKLPDGHSWVFYIHGGSLSKRNQNGLVLLRPAEFPFLADRETAHALSWHLSDARIISGQHKEAFNKCYQTAVLFKQLTPDLQLQKVAEELVPYDMPIGGRWVNRDPIGEEGWWLYIFQIFSSLTQDNPCSSLVGLLRKTQDGSIFVDNNPAGNSDHLGLIGLIGSKKRCLDRKAYDKCLKRAKLNKDICVSLAEKQFDVIMEALELQANLCRKYCWDNKDLNITVRLACVLGCGEILGIQSAIAMSYLTSFTGTCYAAYGVEVYGCYDEATYYVEWGCPCDR